MNAPILASDKVLCTVQSLKALTPTVTQVILTPHEPVQYHAGQYLQIFLADNDKRPFSIAACPQQHPMQLELHIGSAVTDNYASQALAHLQEHLANDKPVLAQVGLGEAYWRQESERPVLLIAGGTGFSYVWSIAQAIALTQPKRHVQLYWGLRQPSAAYHTAELAVWQQPHRQVTWVLQQDAAEGQRTGLVHEAVLHDHADLSGFDIYIAGPFAMVKVLRDAFMAQGAKPAHMFADAFAWL
jgi:aquacobalamin reductase/NAD(P)H-flavin reductase